ncbi:MAG: MBL fold metallo-hydrolase [Acidobacteria bacterium]|nr:MBL fold metallo-hydrolase [Acidobacteriota bacterium]
MRYTRLTAPHDSPFAQGSVHAYLVHGAVPTLVDAPSATPAFLDEIADALTAAGDGPLRQVIVTHGHPDHIDGAAGIHARWPQAVFRKRAPLPVADAIAWQVVEKEPMLAVGDTQMWMIATPGHAPDHACLFDVHEGILIGGDIAMNGSTMAIPADHGGSLRQYMASLHAVLDLQPRVILPGHGEPILQPAALLRGYISHRIARERQVLECLAAGIASTDAIVDTLYAGLADTLRPAARQNAIAHLRKLEEDGRVACAGDDWHLRSA